MPRETIAALYQGVEMADILVMAPENDARPAVSGGLATGGWPTPIKSGMISGGPCDE